MNPQQIIVQIFQQYLGRQPTSSELQGFTQAMGQGIIDPTSLSLFIQGSSQNQMQQVQPGVQGFQQQLQQGNQNVLNQGMDMAQQRFAQQGRPNSSGLGSAYAQVAGNLASQQSPQIANFYGGLYQNALNPNTYGQNYQGAQQNYATAQQDYQNQVNLQQFGYNLGNQAYSRQQQGGALGAMANMFGSSLAGSLGGAVGKGLGGGIGTKLGGLF